MVCGLVDIEFCKLVLGLHHSQGSDTFLNSNINLAAGSGNFTTFVPEPPVPILTGLDSPQPESFTSWGKLLSNGHLRNLCRGTAFLPLFIFCKPDKIEISCTTNEMSVEKLVQYITRSFGVTVDRIFAHGDTADKSIFNALDQQKLEWNIHFDEDGKVTVSDGVFTLWPQVRMAVQMLGRLPPTSGQRAVFKSQVEKVKIALDQTKDSHMMRFTGKVSDAYLEVYRPEDREHQEYFDLVLRGRNYLTLGVDCHTDTKEDIRLPCIKYMIG
jgi:hypothetical protein